MGMVHLGFVMWGTAMAQLPMGLPTCGTDVAHQELLTHSSEYVSLRASLDVHWASDQTTFDGLPLASVSSQATRHLDPARGGPCLPPWGRLSGTDENISDAQILSAIAALNDDFRKVAGSAGDGNGVDVGVEFVLAQRDPDGAPSSGIVRLNASTIPGFAEHGIASASEYLGVDEVTVKSVSAWSRNDYINVFVVPEINGNDGGGGVQGFAFVGPTGDVRDGITVLYNAFGTEGTLKPGRDMNRTLTHEMGHYLTLLHPFWNTTSCVDAGDCLATGDLVCDTPPTLENGSCVDASCPGALLENYMDYAPTSCRNMFTEGQRDRMRTCLATVRSQLLESDGGIPVVDQDFQLQPLEANEVCSAIWEPQLTVLNQGTTEMEGGEIRWSINGEIMPPVGFNEALLPGQSTTVFMPPTPLPVDTSEWIFSVRLANGGLDDYNVNDSLVGTRASFKR